MGKPKRKHFYRESTGTKWGPWNIARTPKQVKHFKDLHFHGENLTKAQVKQWLKSQ
jgi:hypothetical protein